MIYFSIFNAAFPRFLFSALIELRGRVVHDLVPCLGPCGFENRPGKLLIRNDLFHDFPQTLQTNTWLLASHRIRTIPSRPFVALLAKPSCHPTSTANDHKEQTNRRRNCCRVATCAEAVPIDREIAPEFACCPQRIIRQTNPVQVSFRQLISY